ncbi:MAG TPA: molybdopterin containing oxidoreductase [Cytophagales bacterium]|nr:molybdopterin containing oxidoreductase [Cytophagales bacterium]
MKSNRPTTEPQRGGLDGAPSRRDFLKKGALAGFATALGVPLVFGENLPAVMMPVALTDRTDFYELFQKEKELIILNDRPWNVETPAHLLDDAITPASKMFVRNNGLVPQKVDSNDWTLTVDGEAISSTKTYSLTDLKNKFKAHTYQLVLECGGNGRKEFNPPAKGNQWDVGAVHCARWKGVRLRDLLDDAGIQQKAKYIAYYGADIHLTGDPKKVVISRGVPLHKAMQDESLLAYQMNGENIPVAHGAPLRLVFGGWPASTSGKWVTHISVRDRVHDGPKMEAPSYRVPAFPVAPGTKVAEEDMAIIEAMPVKSLITYPKSGAMIPLGRKLTVRGHAWAGEREVSAVHISIDFGATWQEVKLKAPANRLSWQQWEGQVSFPDHGYYEVWVRATDSAGDSQPMVLPGWNPKGYLNNAAHRIAVKVTA